MKLSNNIARLFLGGLFAALLIFAFSCASASAQVIFNNGAVNLANSTETLNADYNSTTGKTNMVGNVFTPTVGGTVSSINFAGLYFASNTVPTSDTFTISFYAVSSGTPIALISTSTLSGVTRSLVGTGGFNGAYSVYEFTGILNTPFNLSAGTSYFVGISDRTFPSEEFNVAYSSGSATSLFEGKLGYGEFEAEPSGALSFSLSGTITSPPASGDTPTMPPWGLAVLALLLFFIAAEFLPDRCGGPGHSKPPLINEAINAGGVPSKRSVHGRWAAYLK
jgi:hypothetical protein